MSKKSAVDERGFIDEDALIDRFLKGLGIIKTSDAETTENKYDQQRIRMIKTILKNFDKTDIPFQMDWTKTRD